MAVNFLKKVGVLTPLAGLILVLVLVNVLLSLSNQFLRMDVTERQQFITQSIQLEEINREIVATLASVAVKSNDRQLKDLLASMGINLVEPGAAGRAK